MNYTAIQEAMDSLSGQEKKVAERRVDPCIETKQVSIPDKFLPGEKVCGHRLLLWPIPGKKVTEGGIELPDDVHRRAELNQVQAVVVSIGPECWEDRKEPWCKVGDKVRIIINSGIVVKSKVDGLTYRIVNDLDVLSVEVDYE